MNIFKKFAPTGFQMEHHKIYCFEVEGGV